MYPRTRTLALKCAAGAALACVGFVWPFAAAQASLVIAAGATVNVSCSHGVCTATSGSAVLGAKRLQNLLASGNVKVVSGSEAGDIIVTGPLSWVSSNTLTLDSYHAITINKPVSVAGSGGLTLTTNDGGTGGAFSFGPKGNVNFWSLSSSLTINGNAYTLVNNIATLASGIASNSSGFYALAVSYDATSDGTYTASPIPTIFTGIFEGLGNTISNLTMNVHKNVNGDRFGFFTQINAPGLVENIGLLNVNIIGGSDTIIGGLAGYSSLGKLVGDYVTGSLTVGRIGAGGGLVGISQGEISNTYSLATVTGGTRSAVGGLVGYANQVIESSYATGHVSGVTGAQVGGLAGAVAGTNVTKCFATGATVGGDYSRVGGLIGWNEGAGGATGVVDGYATGTVSGGIKSNVGGLIGLNDSGAIVGASYSTGSIAGGTSAKIGGLIGQDLSSDDVSDSYWDTTTSGITNLSQGAGNVNHDPGITGLTTVQLRSGLPAGFSASIWGENSSINGGLPYLLANPPT